MATRAIETLHEALPPPGGQHSTRGGDMTRKIVGVELGLAVVGVVCVLVAGVGLMTISSDHGLVPIWVWVAALIVGQMIGRHFFPRWFSGRGGDGGGWGGWGGDGGGCDGGGGDGGGGC
jgi:hypothetical protein